MRKYTLLSTLKRHIYFDYCIGVSAGSANCASYVSRQRGRNLEFYTNTLEN